MATRIARWVLFGVLLTVLVWGGVNRTLALAGDGGDQSVGSEGNGAGAYGAGQTAIRATEWSVAEGSASRVDGSILLVDTESRGRLVVEGQSWAYARSQGFAAQVGDEIAVAGCDEAGEFKAGRLRNQTTGQEVLLRDDAGWSYWSNRYQR